MVLGGQLAVTIGILIAQLVNYGTQHIQYYGWRVSLGIAGQLWGTYKMKGMNVLIVDLHFS